MHTNRGLISHPATFTSHFGNSNKATNKFSFRHTHYGNYRGLSYSQWFRKEKLGNEMVAKLLAERLSNTSFFCPPEHESTNNPTFALYFHSPTYAYSARAQFIQRWTYVNSQPHWRKTPIDPLVAVAFPQYDVILEYNCYWMPAICRNVENWRSDTTKSKWSTREADDVFCYDFSRRKDKFQLPGGSSDHRRAASCPSTWSNGYTRCLEENQPYVMPGLWLFTDLETIDPEAGMEIEGFRLSPETGDIFRSGRQYSYDEFPPATWIEGGSGPGGAANAAGDAGGTEANTYCAPQMIPKCKGKIISATVRSEQNWQGESHNMLQRRLRKQIRQLPNPPALGRNSCVRFRHRLINDVNVGPARAWWKDGNGQDGNSEDGINLIVRRGDEKANKYSSKDRIRDPSLMLPPLGLMQAASSAISPFVPLAIPVEDVEKRTASAVNVDESLTTYSFETQQQHTSDKVDILRIGTTYIFGRTTTSDAASTENNSTSWSSVERPSAVDGPIQCGPNMPCVDDSCCNTDGKCGFKQAHCGSSCISNCDAKAMCGVDSADGKTPCGFKLCCSYYGWCGTESIHCHDPEPQYGKTPCQQGFGLCELIQTIFQMMAMHESDIPLYGEFTALKRNGLQTWIAIGGWSFNDPGPTQTAFSDMASDPKNRVTFINSLLSFMETYGFQGADIDWEYPSDPKRGGRPQDGANFVLLMKEMHAVFSAKGYGISLMLEPDYWYLRGFRPADMQQYVDFMGVMTYDLHGPWDTDVKALGSIVRPQTDITEIDKNLMPLWYDGMDPSKLNLGIAYYGRTYTLSDPKCGQMGCGFVPGKGGSQGNCTAFAGVLSNREIRQIRDEQHVTPYHNKTAMVKYFTYDEKSWVGYDDEETYAMKQSFADERCLGGGGGDANKYISPNSATIIPMAHTTVAPGATLTIKGDVATDVAGLPHDGNRNSPKGPGPDKCGSCSFFRHITSTCCGTGGSIGSPIEIPAGVPLPMDLPFPSDFIPPLPFTDSDSNLIPANQPLPKEVAIPKGTIFPSSFVVPPGQPLREGEDDDAASNATIIWISPNIWNQSSPEASHPPSPPPPISIPIPHITIKPGVPFPTVPPCFFPWLDCPGSEPDGPSHPNPMDPDDPSAPSPPVPPGPHDPEDDLDDDPEGDEGDEGDSEETCLLPQPNPTDPGDPEDPKDPDDSSGSPPDPKPEPPKYSSPNTTQDKVHCYGDDLFYAGPTLHRAKAIQVITHFCASIKDATLGPGEYREWTEDFGGSRGIHNKGSMASSIEIKNGCEWVVDEAECGVELRKPIDRCDTKGENNKSGWTLENNCIRWRMDMIEGEFNRPVLPPPGPDIL
ncbi:Killer toxin subunits alpha/beta-like protein [Cladobotryum mycophilum]|uniref:chitinase n=1 Tax=Cladobotryum mycophilum TaxID=491253 RepID=A0ABR0SQR0_9HYPO